MSFINETIINKYESIYFSNQDSCQIMRPKKTKAGQSEYSIIKYKTHSDTYDFAVNTSNAKNDQLLRICKLIEKIPIIQRANYLNIFEKYYLISELESSLYKADGIHSLISKDLKAEYIQIEIEKIEIKIRQILPWIAYEAIKKLEERNFEKIEHPYYKEDEHYINLMATTPQNQICEVIEKEGFDSRAWRVKIQRAYEDIHHPSHNLLKKAHSEPDHYNWLPKALQEIMDGYYSCDFPPTNANEAQEQIEKIKKHIFPIETEISNLMEEIVEKKNSLKLLNIKL